MAKNKKNITEINPNRLDNSKEYQSEADIHTGVIKEPAAEYGIPVNNQAMQTILMMGLKESVYNKKIKSDNDFISLIRSGIPKEVMNHLMEVTDLSLTEMANIVHTSDRTLRRYQPQENLPQELSERMLELAGLYSRGQDVFGTLANFKEWMDTPVFPLGNKKPKEFLDTSLGIRMLLDELGRIENGVFA